MRLHTARSPRSTSAFSSLSRVAALLFLVIGLCGTDASAASPDTAGKPVVQVFLPPATTTRMARGLLQAMGTTSAIYTDIGVRILWKTGPAPAECSRQPRTIIVTFRSLSPEGIAKNALAFAEPFARSGPCVTLLSPRIESALEANPSSGAALLGHVLAHEIGHYLQGSVRHSETGVMKAHWSLEESAGMGYRRLGFTTSDARSILSPPNVPYSRPGTGHDAP